MLSELLNSIVDINAREVFHGWELKIVDIINILDVLSDHKAFSIFNTIALSQHDTFKPLISNRGITRHQYQSRLVNLKKAGLVKRANGKYKTTVLGNIVYESLSVVGRALGYNWAINAIEQLRESPSMNSVEYMSKVMDALIDDQQIKQILSTQSVMPKSPAISNQNSNLLVRD